MTRQSGFSTFLSGLAESIRPVRDLRSDRFWEVDALRGVAIGMMIVYHLLWDLYGLGGYHIRVYTGFWHYWQIATASSFITLAGIAMALRWQHMRNPRYGPFLARGLELVIWGVVVGVVTFLFDPQRYVQFGILHLIGMSTLLAYPFRRFNWPTLIAGVTVILFAQFAGLLGLHSAWLGPLGLDASPRPAFDYFPFLPWFGLSLIGIFLGKILYKGGERRFALSSSGQAAPLRWLRLAGQNSLLIYLLHQPILIFILILLRIVHL